MASRSSRAESQASAAGFESHSEPSMGGYTEEGDDEVFDNNTGKQSVGMAWKTYDRKGNSLAFSVIETNDILQVMK